MVYDIFDRVVEEKYNGTVKYRYVYSGEGDLAKKIELKRSGLSLNDMDGVRDSKTVDGVEHEYITQGGNVTLERWNDGEEKSLEFIYDNGGAPYSVIYSHGSQKDTYYYILNQQGDVIRIVNSSGATVTDYTYNGWGEILKTDNKIGDFGNLNPIRYRGYYYDSELNMYYLQSRYYDPVMKRMLCADDESLTSGAALNNNNLFTYCDNNPVNRADVEGDIWNIVAGAAIGAISNIALTVITDKITGERITKEEVIKSGIVGACSGAVGVFDSTKANVLINALAAGGAEYYTQRKAGSSVKNTIVNVAFAAGTAAISSLAGGHSVRKSQNSCHAKPKNTKNSGIVSKSARKSVRISASSSRKKVAMKSLKNSLGKVHWKNYMKNLRNTTFVSTYFFNGPKMLAHYFYRTWKRKSKAKRR